MRRFRLSRLTLALIAGLAAVPLTLPPTAQAGIVAVDAARIKALGDQMQLGPLLSVLREEGLSYGDDLNRDLLGGSGGVSWRAEVARIYDPAAGRAKVDAALSSVLAEDAATLTTLEDFFSSDLGAKVAGLEVAARRAFLDDAAKDAATVVWQDMVDRGDPRVAKLTRFTADLGLIEQNVEGSLNANLAFFQGLNEGGGMQNPLTGDDLLAQVAGQEDRARAAAEAWLYPYLALAYQPLTEAELDEYLAFAASEAGQRGNRATFRAFDQYFATLSHDLGLAASRRMAGQDI
jgi:hypothetical protein